jgi:hypothetical protein
LEGEATTSRRTYKVVKRYNIISLPRGENKLNPIIVTIWFGEERSENSETEPINFNFDSFRYRGHNESTFEMPDGIGKLEEKVRNLSLEYKSLEPKEPCAPAFGFRRVAEGTGSKRKSLPKQVTDMVWTMYEPPNSTIGKCYCCGREILLVPKNFECGHVISRYNGGSDNIYNLRPICSSCNKSMGTRDMREYMQSYGYDRINEECFLTLH